MWRGLVRQAGAGARRVGAASGWACGLCTWQFPECCSRVPCFQARLCTLLPTRCAAPTSTAAQPLHVQAEGELHEVASHCELEGLGGRGGGEEETPLSSPLPREGPLLEAAGDKPADAGDTRLLADATAGRS